MKKILIYILIIISCSLIATASITFCENCITIYKNTNTEPIETINTEPRLKETKIVQEPYLELSKSTPSIAYKTLTKIKDIDPLPIDKYKIKDFIIKPEFATQKNIIKPIYEVEYSENDTEFNHPIKQKFIGYYDIKNKIDYVFDTNKLYKIGNQSIVWNAGGYIHIKANSTHGTAKKPHTFKHIYNMDVLNGWGCFIAGNNDYNFYVFNGTKCYLRIEGNSTALTYFSDNATLVVVDGSKTTTNGKISMWNIRGYVVFTEGVLQDINKKTTMNPITYKVISHPTYYFNLFTTEITLTNVTVNRYGTQFYSIPATGTTYRDITMMIYQNDNYEQFRVWNNVMRQRAQYTTINNADIFNQNDIYTLTTLRSTKNKVTTSNIYSNGNNMLTWIYYTGETKGVIYLNNTGPYWITVSSITGTKNHNLTNVYTDKKVLSSRWYLGNNHTNTVDWYQEYFFNTQTQNGMPINNVNVSIYRNNGALVYSGLTNTKGLTTIQKLKWGYYKFPNSDYVYGSTTFKTYTYPTTWYENEYNPYNITFSKIGYLPKTFYLNVSQYLWNTPLTIPIVMQPLDFKRILLTPSSTIKISI